MKNDHIHKDKFEEIEKAISTANMGHAITLLEKIKPAYHAKHQQSIVLITKRWNELNDESTIGVLSKGKESIRSTKIGSSMLKLLERLKKEVIYYDKTNFNSNLDVLFAEIDPEEVLEENEIVSEKPSQLHPFYIKLEKKLSKKMQVSQPRNSDEKPEPVFASLRFIEENLTYVIEAGNSCENLRNNLGPLYLNDIRKVNETLSSLRSMVKRVKIAKEKILSIKIQIPFLKDLENCERILGLLMISFYDAAQKQQKQERAEISQLKIQLHDLSQELSLIHSFLRKEKSYLSRKGSNK